MRKRSSLFILGSLLVVLASCQQSTTVGPTVDISKSSWLALQTKVITPKCVSCHSAGTDYATQSGLVLTSDVAYKNLVNVAAHYDNAHADGLKRVVPGNGDSSFLYLKLHGFPAGKEYGSPMPLGDKQLSIGQMEFVRQWIDAGAPDTGVVADVTLLDDTTHLAGTDFVPLPPPLAGEGYQLHLQPFTVSNTYERELFSYKPIGNTSDIFVNRIQTRMRPNSHHFLLYTFQSGTPASIIPKDSSLRDIRRPDGSEITQNTSVMAYHQFFAGSTSPELDYRLPEGVALYVPANTSLDLNAHYVNHTGGDVTGECFANLYTVPASQVTHPATTLFLPNTSFSLPPHQQTVVRQTTLNTYGTTLHIFMLTSHMHKRGQDFKIYFQGKAGDSRNGQLLYESTDWEHPPIKTFDTPIVLNPGEGISTEVTYYNETNKTISFGLTSEDEMDIVFGYLY